MQATVSNRRNGLILLLTGLLAISIIILVNRSWFSRIAGYWKAFPRQLAQPDLEARKASRYGNAYILSRSIALSLERTGKKDSALVLLPPASYFKAKGLDYHVPEPAVFYYYTSLRTVRPDTKDTAGINYVVTMENKHIAIRKVKNKEQLSSILAEYRKYKITL